jgi:hypothetical protein
MCGAMEDELSNGDICGVWVYVGGAHEPTSQSRTGWFSNQSFGEGMKSWDEISEAVNVNYEQTQHLGEPMPTRAL